jgi:glycerophosphoryl diester phosphodiesterase
MNLWRDPERPFVIGHRGAAGVAPENTLASLEAAVDAGVDIVEFDVQPDLRLGHTPGEPTAEAPSLDDALDYLGAQGKAAHLDLKLPGYEADVLAAVRRHGMDDRAYISTTWPATLRTLALLAPALPRAIGYPRDRHGVSKLPWPPIAGQVGAAAARIAMPLRVPVLLQRTGATVLALHHTLCTTTVVKLAHARRVPVLAWTTNDPGAVRRAASLGVDGVVTDDPRMALATLNRL